jgi:DNA-binding NarL/FixJ family response regulator
MGSSKPYIKIVVADDYPMYRSGLARVLEPESDMTLVGEAANGMDTILVVEKHDPEILLLDLGMPVMDGIQVLSELGKRKLRVRAILLIDEGERERAVEAVRLGARGVLFKSAEPDLLVRSIRKVYAGDVWIDSPILSQALESLVSKGPAGAEVGAQHDSRISTREMEVVRCIAMGLRNKEIADKLGVSEATVKNHLTNIYTKLGVNDRLELTLYAIHNRMVRI